MNPYAKLGDAIVGLAPEECTRRLREGYDHGDRPGLELALEAVGIGMAIERLERSMLPGCFAAVTDTPMSFRHRIMLYTDTARIQHGFAAGLLR